MKGYGLIKTTLLDFPGMVAAVVFTPGCNLRCPWCHNPGLVRWPWDSLQTEEAVLSFLRMRRNVLQGVVVTGGEPLFLPDLDQFLEKLRGLGYQIKLDTNGTFPERLAALAPGLVDFVAVDIKNAPSAYAKSAGLPVRSEKLSRTLALLRERFPRSCEVRLTWVPALNDPCDLDEYARFVGPDLPVWVQGYRPGPGLDPHFSSRPPSPAELEAVTLGLLERGLDARLRG